MLKSVCEVFEGRNITLEVCVGHTSSAMLYGRIVEVTDGMVSLQHTDDDRPPHYIAISAIIWIREYR